MPPFINLPGPVPFETPTVVEGLMDNPTVTPTEKALYVAGIIFTFLCLLLDIGMLVYIGVKVYRLCRRRRGAVTHEHGTAIVVENEEKGLFVDGHEEYGGEQLPAYHDAVDAGTDNWTMPAPIILNEMPGQPLIHGKLNVNMTVNGHGVEEAITLDNLRDYPHLSQYVLDMVKSWEANGQGVSLPLTEGANQEIVELINQEIIPNMPVVSQTSKAAHMSPHENCLACRKLAQRHSIQSCDLDGNEESVTFPLTWDDMYHHGKLIKWFLNNHNLEDFIMEPDQHYIFDNGEPMAIPTPNSKAAHLLPHGHTCAHCVDLAGRDGISITNPDGTKNAVTFPLTMDDMLEHRDLINMYLDGAVFSNPGTVAEHVHFDEDIRLPENCVGAAGEAEHCHFQGHCWS